MTPEVIVSPNDLPSINLVPARVNRFFSLSDPIKTFAGCQVPSSSSSPSHSLLSPPTSTSSPTTTTTRANIVDDLNCLFQQETLTLQDINWSDLSGIVFVRNKEEESFSFSSSSSQRLPGTCPDPFFTGI